MLNKSFCLKLARLLLLALSGKNLSPSCNFFLSFKSHTDSFAISGLLKMKEFGERPFFFPSSSYFFFFLLLMICNYSGIREQFHFLVCEGFVFHFIRS